MADPTEVDCVVRMRIVAYSAVAAAAAADRYEDDVADVA